MWQGCFHPFPVSAQRGLLQGCPASPCLLNAMMVVWARFVLLQEPRAAITLFLDDRTIRKRGAQSVDTVVNAMNAGTEAGAVLGLELHPDKLASFASQKHLQQQLMLQQDIVGKPTEQFLLLGIQYNLGNLNACVDHTTITDVVQERCRKIRIAARQVGVRKLLLQQLVISLFAWTGAFHHYFSKVVVQWTSLIEAAIWGRKPPPGRSRFLFWNSIGSPRLHPDFVLLFEATRTEWNRRCRLACGLSAPGRPGPRWKAVQQKWRWTVDDHGNWRTPDGRRGGYL